MSSRFISGQSAPYVPTFRDFAPLGDFFGFQCGTRVVGEKLAALCCDSCRSYIFPEKGSITTGQRKAFTARPSFFGSMLEGDKLSPRPNSIINFGLILAASGFDRCLYDSCHSRVMSCDQIGQVMFCPQHIGDLTFPWPSGHSEM